ncbi:MAG: serine hydrolase [Candidatus Bathyarchaeia archaeon]|jgi:beta-lactamase class A
MGLETALQNAAAQVRGRIGVAVAELSSGLMTEINSDESYRAASIIKIPILYELFRKSEKQKLDLNGIHPVSESNTCTGSGVIRMLHKPLPLTLKDLATLMIVVSDNSATNEVIDIVGIDDVNSTMERLGLHRTILRRKMLGDAGGNVPFEKDNVSSPRDLVTLLQDIYSANHLTCESCNSMLEIMKLQQLKHKIPHYLPANVQFASKSGTVKGVSNDAAILFLKRPIALAVMCGDLEHSSYGSDSIASIGRLVYEYYC